MSDCTSRQRDRPRSDAGSVTAFVVIITIAVLACAGLAVDGARIVGAKVSAADHAANAARAGAQQIATARDGQWLMDPVRATDAADAYLRARGISGTVVATPTRITVTVTAVVHTSLLSLVGVSSKRVTATRSSDPISQ